MSEETKKQHEKPKEHKDGHSPASHAPRHDHKEDLEEIGSPGGLIGGDGLLKMLEDMIPLLGGMGMMGDGPMDKSIGGKFENGTDPHHDVCDLADTPLDVIGDEDLDNEDETVKEFNSKDGGLKGVVRVIKMHGPDSIEHIAAIVERLRAVRAANRLQTMRNVFACIHAVRQGNGAQYQVQAVDALTRLAADTIDSAERSAILKARESVLAGDDTNLDAASFRVRGVFAAYVPSRTIRVAYTSLSTQAGEPFQLCPKAKGQIGVAVPMEISKCRDNCIDSRTTRDGKVSCAFTDWLRVAADSNLAVQARFETIRHPDNNLLNLGATRNADGSPIHESNVVADKRSHKDHDDEDHNTYEQRMLALKDRNKAPSGDSREKQLDDSKLYGHQGDKKIEKEQTKEVFQKTACCSRCKSSCDGSCCGKCKGRKATNERAKRLDPKSDENLGKQVEKVNTGEGNDERTDDRLEDDKLYGRKGVPTQRSQDLNKSALKETLSNIAGEDRSRQAAWNAVSNSVLPVTSAKKINKLDPKKEENLGEQIAADHVNDGKKPKYDDKTISEMIESKHKGLTDDELDYLLTEWLEKDHVEGK